MDDIQNDENQNLIDDAEEATTGMDEIDGFDFERAAMLMGVMEKQATIGVKATAIGGLAAAALNEMNEEAKAIAKRRAEAMRDLERKRDEKLAQQRADQEAQAHAEADETQQLNVHPQPPVAKPAPAPAQRRV